jgi:hypothetical protein
MKFAPIMLTGILCGALGAISPYSFFHWQFWLVLIPVSFFAGVGIGHTFETER